MNNGELLLKTTQLIRDADKYFIELNSTAKGILHTFDDIIDNMGGETFIDNLKNYDEIILFHGDPKMLQAVDVCSFIDYIRNKYNFTPIVWMQEPDGGVNEYLKHTVQKWIPNWSSTGI